MFSFTAVEHWLHVRKIPRAARQRITFILLYKIERCAVRVVCKQPNNVHTFQVVHNHNVMLSFRVLRMVSELAYLFLVLITVVATGLSCAALLSQAIRTPGHGHRTLNA